MNARDIYKRDGYKCRICGAAEFGLNIHHISPVKLGGSNDTNNLITLCLPCHKFMHVNPMLVMQSKEIHSENIKIALMKLKETGKKLGRPMGMKDKMLRKTDGYWERYKNKSRRT